MRKLTSWATRIALIAAATTGVVAACYDKVPGPSGPLPPTKEAKGLGPKPKKIKPSIVEMSTEVSPAHEGPSVADNQRDPPDRPSPAGPQEPAPVPPPTTTNPAMRDAGIDDVVDLPPVPDSSVPFDAPVVHTR